MSQPSYKNFGTDCIHAGQEPDPVTGAVMTPISLSTTFVQKSPGQHTGYEYARTGNPTRNAYEACVAKCENGKHGLAFASGLAATATLLHLLKSGDEIIAMDDMYGGTNRYFHKVAQPFANLKFNLVDLTNLEAFESAMNENIKMVWIETPTNPTLKISDIQALSDIAHAVNSEVIVVVDNTFLSPYFQRPLDFGADIVLHSVSKYINGHSDVIGGIVITNSDEINEKLRFLQNGMGAIQGVFSSFLAMRGLKTLHVRMKQHAINAQAVAEFLESHEKVERVIYPGLPSHPQYELAQKQQTGFGGMVTFFIKGGLDESRTFLENLKVFSLAESLGGVESLAEHPAIMTHASVPPELRKKLGISDTLIRLSVGIEETEDILEDISNALDQV
eukprot:TRINITY_DN16428_c0_g1_i1.p1 TRINITY_DN16428_c0_g1~~TRINITY_DN16428_c0_g1_i1.p1  ORF type:complete len:417 (-),score=174.38 TRINITY_DN16428_c0_g1_i1:215-1384(-)